MAIQQVVPISILLQGDGSTGTFVFNLGDVYQISSGSAVNYGNLGFIPTGIEVPNPPAPLISATIDSATGIITLTLLAPIPAGVILNFILNLLFNSGDAVPFPGPFQPTTVGARLQDGSGNPISSTGDALDITGTVSISGTVPISGSISVSNFPASQVVTLASTTITGSVAVTGTFFQATQPVSGTIAVSNFPATQPVRGTITANAGTGTFTVGGTVAVSNFPATQPVSGSVAVSNFPATQPVSGTIAATQSGTWTVGISAGQTIAATNAGTFAVQVTNFPASQVVTLASTTITGTVAVTQSTSPWVVSLASTTITGTATVAGNKTTNNAAPGATNVGALVGIANAAAPAYTEGDQVLESLTLTGAERVTQMPTTQGGSLSKVAQGLTTTVNVKASAGQLYGYAFSNPNAVNVL